MKTKLLIIALLICSATSAQALDFEASVGHTKYNSALDTLWATPGFESNIDKMHATSGEFAVNHNIWQSESGQYGLDLRGSYVYLGSVKTTAQSPNRNTNTVQGQWVGEDFLGARAGNPCDGACNNLATFNGTGHDMGVTLQLEPYVKYKGYRLGVNGGYFHHRVTWGVGVQNIWDGIENKNIVVESEGKWTAGKVLGVSVQKENLTIRAQYFMTPLTGGKYPQAWDKAFMLSIGFKF